MLRSVTASKPGAHSVTTSLSSSSEMTIGVSHEATAVEDIEGGKNQHFLVEAYKVSDD